MEVEVRIQAEAIRGYIARRLRFALGRSVPRLGRMLVRISDANGTRGGVDQCCHISVGVPHKGQVVLDQVDADLFVAIDRACARIGEVFEREIQRSRDARAGRESVRIPA